MNTYKSGNFDDRRVEVNRKGLSVICNCIDKVSYGENRDCGNENQFRKIQEIGRYILILAIPHIEYVKNCKSPQEGTRDIYQGRLFEASCKVWRFSVPSNTPILLE